MVKKNSVTSVADEGSVAGEGDRGSTNVAISTSTEANAAVNTAVNAATSTAETRASPQAIAAVNAAVDEALVNASRRSDVWDYFTVTIGDSNFTHERVHCPVNQNKIKFNHDRNGSGSYSSTRTLNHLRKIHPDIWITTKSGRKSAEKEE